MVAKAVHYMIEGRGEAKVKCSESDDHDSVAGIDPDPGQEKGPGGVQGLPASTCAEKRSKSCSGLLRCLQSMPGSCFKVAGQLGPL